MLIFPLDLKEVEEVRTGGVNFYEVFVCRRGWSWERCDRQVERALDLFINSFSTDKGILTSTQRTRVGLLSISQAVHTFTYSLTWIARMVK